MADFNWTSLAVSIFVDIILLRLLSKAHSAMEPRMRKCPAFNCNMDPENLRFVVMMMTPNRTSAIEIKPIGLSRCLKNNNANDAVNISSTFDSSDVSVALDWWKGKKYK